MEVKKLVMCCVLGSVVSAPAVGAVKMNLDDGTVLTIGGYVKFDARYVDGEVAYRDYWNGPGNAVTLGSGTSNPPEASHLNFNAKETRLFVDVAKNGWSGRIEGDFYGDNGNQGVSNSDKFRIRHAFMKNANWLIGQSWTTFMPLHAISETLDFGGPQNAMVFVRQPQVRYSNGGFHIALETPETAGDDDDKGVSGGAAGTGAASGTSVDPDETFPDIVVRYDFKGDWGVVSLAGLIRQIDPGDAPAADDTSFGANIAGKINVGEKDDFKFELNFGESGRYVGVGLTKGGVTQTVPAGQTTREVLETTTYKFSFRHFWSDSLRSTVFYGLGENDEVYDNTNALVAGSGIERVMFGVNLINQITPNMWVGGELGQYSINDMETRTTEKDLSSNYFQVSTKYVF